MDIMTLAQLGCSSGESIGSPGHCLAVHAGSAHSCPQRLWDPCDLSDFICMLLQGNDAEKEKLRASLGSAILAERPNVKASTQS